jgi:hypothetical protein
MKVALMRQAQQTYGNRALRRALQPKLATGATNIAAPPQLASSPATGAIFIQRLRTGSATNKKKNIDKALEELDEITDPSDVSEGCVALDKREPGVLDRYKREYKNDYLANLGDQATFQWPLTYLRGRAARKLGKSTEDDSIQSVYGDEVTKNNQAFSVEIEKGVYEDYIPDVFTDDVVADAKNVANQSFDRQLRAFYIIAKGEDPFTGKKRKVKRGGEIVPNKKRKLELIVRSDTHPDGETTLSGPLKQFFDEIHFEI